MVFQIAVGKNVASCKMMMEFLDLVMGAPPPGCFVQLRGLSDSPPPQRTMSKMNHLKFPLSKEDSQTFAVQTYFANSASREEILEQKVSRLLFPICRHINCEFRFVDK